MNNRVLYALPLLTLALMVDYCLASDLRPKICSRTLPDFSTSGTLVSTFARRFDVSQAPGTRVKIKAAITLRPANGVHVVLRPAPASVALAPDPAPPAP